MTLYQSDTENCIELLFPMTIQYSQTQVSNIILLINPLQITVENQLENKTKFEVEINPTQKIEKQAKSVSREVDDEDVESKKNKIKQKRKSRNKLLLREEDALNEFKVDYSKTAENSSLALSLARPTKPKKLESSNLNKDKNTKNNISNKIIINKKSEIISRKIAKDEAVLVNSIEISKSLTIQELSQLSQIPQEEIIKFLFLQGIIANVNQLIDINTATKVSKNFGIEVNNLSNQNTKTSIKQSNILDNEDPTKLESRSPIVTIMGHVDHGKTSLLDAIRNSNNKVAEKEAGGITQTIGTYEIDIQYKEKTHTITFLDTPGHEAFIAMRERGIRLADIGILVIAADDGIKQQTEEAIKYIQKSKLSMIIAITKIDKTDSQIEKIKENLTHYNIISEDWGGEIPVIPISAHKRTNINELIENILLIAELENLQANPNRAAKGTIIESHLDKTKGPVANIIIQNGTLNIGDIIYSGKIFGKIRTMIKNTNQKIQKAGPSSVVEISGISELASIGDNFEVCKSEKEAKNKAEEFKAGQQSIILPINRLNTSNIEYSTNSQTKYLQFVLKAKTQGTLESIIHCIEQIPQNKVKIEILAAHTGEITESDINLVIPTNAIIIGFDTSYAPGAKQAAERNKITIKQYNIIYDLINDIETKMISLLDPEYIENEIGTGEIKATFNLSKGIIAGCYILNGKLKRNSLIKIFRNQQEIYAGNLDSIKKVKEDVEELDAKQECGIFIESFQDWQKGDIINVFSLIERKQTLK
uniref:Translation initiation factor IF-2, chloroplastic n=1 Tax=Rhodochaete parvula TaxID=110510 RepID=A0A1X9PV43_9RHOD|nr:initiation factor IF2 [Rhodochaete parvula]ASK39558.1 translation initiation factor 2 [Rhodochaete parvula]